MCLWHTNEDENVCVVTRFSAVLTALKRLTTNSSDFEEQP